MVLGESDGRLGRVDGADAHERALQPAQLLMAAARADGVGTTVSRVIALWTQRADIVDDGGCHLLDGCLNFRALLLLFKKL